MSDKVTPIWVGSPNFWEGRKGHNVLAIVLHVEDGSEVGTESWFQSKDSQVSATYSVSRAGVVHQYVKETDSAWANGIVNNPTWKFYDPAINPNLQTISIEQEGHPDEDWPDVQIQATIDL